MRRREFLTGISVAAVWSSVARAQPSEGKPPRIGIIQNVCSENYDALIEGLRELGYVHGHTALLDTRFHGSIPGRTDELARELVGLKCRVIFAADPYSIGAAVRATDAIPIVGIDLEDDPVANGWAQSIARPGAILPGCFSIFPNWG